MSYVCEVQVKRGCDKVMGQTCLGSNMSLKHLVDGSTSRFWEMEKFKASAREKKKRQLLQAGNYVETKNTKQSDRK